MVSVTAVHVKLFTVLSTVITSLLNSVIRYLSSVLSKSSPPRYVSPFVALTCKASTVLDATVYSVCVIMFLPSVHCIHWTGSRYREMDKVCKCKKK